MDRAAEGTRMAGALDVSPSTLRNNLFVPEVWTEAIRQGFLGVKALMGTDAVIINPTLPVEKRGGDRVTVPYFENVGEVQDVVEGQPLSPISLEQSEEVALVNRSGIAIDMTRWAELAAAEDPYTEATAQFVEALSRRVDMAALQAAAGDAAVGAAAETNFLPIGSNGTTLVNNLGSGTMLDYDSLVDSKMLWHDEQDDISLLVVHSVTFGNLLKLKDSTGRPLVTEVPGSIQGQMLQRFLNIPLKVSDRIQPQDGLYTSLMFKRKSVAFWYNLKPAMTSVPDPLTDSQVTAFNMYWVAYAYKNLNGKRYPGVVAIQHGN